MVRGTHRLFNLQIMHFWEGHMKISIQLLILLFVFGSHTLFAAGDAEAGKAKSAPCAACHGADGNSVNPTWPKLAGQGAPYLVEQLEMFKDGTRANALMAPQAAALSEQDMHDLAAFYASQTGSPGAADPELVEMGEAIYRGGIIDKDVTACTACHLPNGAGNLPAKFPKLILLYQLWSVLPNVLLILKLKPWRSIFRVCTKRLKLGTIRFQYALNISVIKHIDIFCAISNQSDSLTG